MSPAISTQNLRKEWGDMVALKDISFEVSPGSVVALVGPNGAGKTTWMKTVAGLVEPSRGTVYVDGLDVRQDPKQVHQRLGYLPDFFGMYTDLTAHQYLSYFCRAYQVDPIQRPKRIEQLLQQVGLEDKTHAEIRNLSRGMKQRVGIARAMIQDPPILLLDEPASGLDPEARHSLQTLFLEFANQGKTLVISSHILTELEQYCTDVVILQSGRVVKVESIGGAKKINLQKIHIRVRKDLEKLIQILNQNELIADIQSQDQYSCYFQFQGSQDQQVELLKSLIQKNFSILSFGPDQTTIQDTYLSLMKDKP